MADPVPYDETTTSEWAAAVNAWPWTSPQHASEWKKDGTCPRCDHVMDLVIPVEVTVLHWFGSRNKSVDPPADAVIECNCTMPHPGRPDGRAGCGASAVIDGPPRNG